MYLAGCFEFDTKQSAHKATFMQKGYNKNKQQCIHTRGLCKHIQHKHSNIMESH